MIKWRESALNDLFVLYFNEDWDLEGKTWQEVLEKAVLQEGKTDMVATLTGLKKLLGANLSDSELSDILLGEFHCSFSPRSIGMTDRQWLQAMADHLEERAGPNATNKENEPQNKQAGT